MYEKLQKLQTSLLVKNDSSRGWKNDFLDANAFYSYYGRSTLGMTSEPVDEERLKKYLEQQREKSLPTSVYIEIMTHFRNNPKVLQNLLEFRFAKGLPLFNNIPDYVVSEDEITSVKSFLCIT